MSERRTKLTDEAAFGAASKPVRHFSEVVWENRAAEHLRDGCAECRAGGCLADPQSGVWATYK